MTTIVINLERGPEGQPVGHLRRGSGQIVAFTGWLDLIRVLEDELRMAGGPAGEGASDDNPSSAD